MKLRKIAAAAAAVMMAASLSAFTAFADAESVAGPAGSAGVAGISANTQKPQPAETKEEEEKKEEEKPAEPAAEEVTEEEASEESAEETPEEEKRPEGVYEIDGKTYCFDKDQTMVKSRWYTGKDGITAYYMKDGARAENISLNLDGRFYRFGDKGAIIYADPEEGSNVTTLRFPPMLGATLSSLYRSDEFGDSGIVCWKKAKARTDVYAYNAHTYINGKKCPMTLEFNRHYQLTAWYMDIPVNEDEAALLLYWMCSFWGTDCEVDENSSTAYWYYTDDATGQKYGVAFSSDGETYASISSIIL